MKTKTLEIIDKATLVLFYKSNLTDLILAVLDKSYRVDLWHSAGIHGLNGGWVKDNGWGHSVYIQQAGQIRQNENGFIFSTNSATLKAKIEVTVSDSYEVWIRAGVGPSFSGYLIFRLNGQEREINLLAEEHALRWFKLGNFLLERGQHTAEIVSSQGGIVLDEMIVVPSRITDQLSVTVQQKLSNIPRVYVNKATDRLDHDFTKKSSCTLRYIYISPVEYRVTVEEPSSCRFIVFLETFDEGWKLRTNSHEYPSLIAYGMVNSFFIGDNEEKLLSIIFGPQKYVELGGQIGLIMIGVVLGYTLWRMVRNK
jgi:hypothetical protein